ncbi:hypothetical protein BGP_3081 [Beggiatoa sp. PS]|nr:hypothetical protein BGP_3081 [Beggiatoa sp. PS]
MLLGFGPLDQACSNRLVQSYKDQHTSYGVWKIVHSLCEAHRSAFPALSDELVVLGSDVEYFLMKDCLNLPIDFARFLLLVDEVCSFFYLIS